jgi:hypothetical protein
MLVVKGHCHSSEHVHPASGSPWKPALHEQFRPKEGASSSMHTVFAPHLGSDAQPSISIDSQFCFIPRHESSSNRYHIPVHRVSGEPSNPGAQAQLRSREGGGSSVHVVWGPHGRAAHALKSVQSTSASPVNPRGHLQEKAVAGGRDPVHVALMPHGDELHSSVSVTTRETTSVGSITQNNQ